MNRTDVSPSAGNQQGNYNKQNISQIPKTYFARAGSDLAGVHWSENRPPSRGVMSCTVHIYCTEYLRSAAISQNPPTESSRKN